jgi:hypothetical protein
MQLKIIYAIKNILLETVVSTNFFYKIYAIKNKKWFNLRSFVLAQKYMKAVLDFFLKNHVISYGAYLEIILILYTLFFCD